jgi:manganese transport protein
VEAPVSKGALAKSSLSGRAREAGAAALAGRSGGPRAFLPFLGPAVITSIAYMDPGNFATNIEAGAKYGYLLLWVVVAANLIAMLFQALSAKLGIVTGQSLAAQCRAQFRRPVVVAFWFASEIAAMATDLAELLGASVGLSLLLGLPLIVSVAFAGIATYAMLRVQAFGFRPTEILIGVFIAVIGLSYAVELAIVPPNWAALAYHSVVPHLSGGHSITLAVGIIGATVMPHAIYLHSSLTHDRMPAANAVQRRNILRYSNTEVLLALGLAGLVNLAMVTMAARVFHDGVHDDVAQIETAYRTLVPLLGVGAAAVFMISLLASGFASSVVGTMAGQVIMQDFVRFRTPLWFRRLITMLPALVVVGLGVNATEALVLSQVVLSLVLPVPMIALLIFTGRRELMGEFTNGRLTHVAAIMAAAVVIVLNVMLVLQAVGLPLPL